jgi:hypothetical protein
MIRKKGGAGLRGHRGCDLPAISTCSRSLVQAKNLLSFRPLLRNGGRTESPNPEFLRPPRSQRA